MTEPSNPRPAARRSTAAALAPATVGLTWLVLYVRTLMPGMAFDDWGEMQTVPHVLGVAHPTGYPTYVLTAWLFELLPVGSVAWRANLLSAVCVAVALATLVAIAQRVGVHPLLAGAAGLATGAVGTIWASAVVAEVNPLHLALVALLVHRSLVWADGRRLRDLALGGLLVGLAAGNHLLSLFVAPFFIVFALWAGRRELLAQPWWLAAPALAALAGLAVYAYVPLAAAANPPLPYNHPTTWDGFVFLVTGEQFRGQYNGLFTTESVQPFLASIGDLWTITAERASPAFALAGLAGLGVLVVRRTAFGLACWGALLVGIDIWANYLRLEHYLLVPWLLLGIGAAVALQAIADLARRIVPAESRQAVIPATGLVAGVLAIAVIAGNVAAADRSDDTTAEQYVATVFGALPENAAILSFWGASTPLWHATLVERQRPDVLVVDDTNIVYEGWGTRENRIASLICERPVFIFRDNEADLAPTRAQYRLEPVTPVVLGYGGPSADATVTLYRVEPPPGACG